MSKLSKRAKRFASSGKLSQAIKSRRQFQKKKKGHSKGVPREAEDDPRKQKKRFEEEDSEETNGVKDVADKKRRAVEELDVDDFLKADFLESDTEGDSAEDQSEDEADSEAEKETMDSEDEAFVAELKRKKRTHKEEEDLEQEDNSESELEDEVDSHMKELEALKSKDPEFFKFLAQNDKNLLKFGHLDEDDEDEEQAASAEGTDEEEDEEAGDQEEQVDKKKEAKKKKKAKVGKEDNEVVLTFAIIKQLEKSAIKASSIRALKHMLYAFREGVHMGDTGEKEERTGITLYRITSSSVFQKLMVTVLLHCHQAFDKHLGISSPTASEAVEEGEETQKLEAEKQKKQIQKHPKWPAIHPLLRGFFKDYLHLLEHISDPGIVAFTLKALRRYVHLLFPFPKLAVKFLKVLLNLWGSAEMGSVPMLAYLRIRQLAMEMPFPFVEDCMKGMYLAYVRNSKFTNETSLPRLTLMGNCVVDLFGIDLTSAYQHAFVYVRQLAIHLRKAIVSKTKEALKNIFNWQFYNSLKVWAAVLCAYPEEGQLRPLLYPLVQVIVGTIKLVPTARYFPLRLHCCRLLQQLAVASNQFIPTSPYLIEVLNSSDVRRRPTSTGGKPLDLPLTLKLQAQALNNKAIKEALVSRTFELLSDEVEIYRWSISFPELCLVSCSQLRKYASSCKVPRWSSTAKSIAEGMEKQSKVVESRRAHVEFGPKDLDKMKLFCAKEAEESRAKLQKLEAERQKKSEILSAEAAKRNAAKRQREDESDAATSEEEEREVAPATKSRKKKQKKDDEDATDRVKRSNTVSGDIIADEEDVVQDIGSWSESEEDEESD